MVIYKTNYLSILCWLHKIQRQIRHAKSGLEQVQQFIQFIEHKCEKFMYTQLQTVKTCIIYQTIGQCVSHPVAYENLRMYIKIQGILNFDNMP
jgi:hypothetical protein